MPVELAASPTGGRPRLKKLRFLLILLAVLLLGLVSFVFGMFMAVASDLPSLDNRQEFNNARNSVLLDDLGRPLGVLSRKNQILLTPGQIPRIVKEAVISIEDKRFASNSGIDIRGIARAFVQDIMHQGTVQGASTIEQQFVKNALQAQSHRTIFEKLREVALAYQLAHKWSKEKIITEYLNTIYFGNGAYGIEAAARTYFGQDVNHVGCGTPKHQLCIEQLEPAEAALLAGIIQSPTYYDPVTHPASARARRDLVLKQMLEQGYLTRADYEESVAQSLPAPKDIQPPHQSLVEGIDAGYFTSWVSQQVIERYGATRAFDGGLQIRTTLDLGHAARRRTGGRCLSPGSQRSNGVARGDRKLHRRGARDGGRAQLQRKPLQPRHAGRAPAGLLLQGVRPRGGAAGRHLPRLGVELAAEDLLRSGHGGQGKVRGSQRRRLLHRLGQPHRRHRLLRQLDLRGSRPKGGHPPHRQPRAPDGHHHPHLYEPGDDDRRPEGRGHATGYGARIRDDRPRRRARRAER